MLAFGNVKCFQAQLRSYDLELCRSPTKVASKHSKTRFVYLRAFLSGSQ